MLQLARWTEMSLCSRILRYNAVCGNVIIRWDALLDSARDSVIISDWRSWNPRLILTMWALHKCLFLFIDVVYYTIFYFDFLVNCRLDKKEVIWDQWFLIQFRRDYPISLQTLLIIHAPKNSKIQTLVYFHLMRRFLYDNYGPKTLPKVPLRIF